MSQTPLQKLRQAHANGITLGLKEVAGVVPRLDIDVLLDRHPDTFNLFLLALDELQKMDPDDRWSYFQIAGIHGLPRRLWDGVDGKDVSTTDFTEGYCAHGIPTFPTWHRPYLVMLEQSLFLRMLDIAEKWTSEADKERYRKAAYQFRLPYWDYYRARSDEKVTFPGVIENGMTSFPFDFSAPLVFTTKALMVHKYPSDKPVLLDPNPLYAYHFPKSPTEGIPAADWQAAQLTNQAQYSRTVTKRYPLSQAGEPFDSDSTATLNAVLNALRMDLNRLAVNMMGDKVYADYNGFSNHETQPDPERRPPAGSPDSVIWTYNNASGSLESIHDTYHLLIGGDATGTGLQMIGRGGGHMSSVPVAAFDPIFWMHHCQIERFFSIWQKVHEGDPNSWFHTETVDSATSPLLPFRKQAGNAGADMWDSDNIKDWTTLGYSFEETAGSSQDVINRFKKMYDWSIFDPLHAPKNPSKEELLKKIPDDMKPIDVRKSSFFQFTAASGSVPAVSLLSTTGPAAAAIPAAAATSSAPEANINAFSPLPGSPVEPGSQLNKDGIRREWYIDDEVARMAYNGAFTIYYFVSDETTGAAPANDSHFLMAPTLVGVHHIFAAPKGVCNNCSRQDEENQLESGTVPITSMLLDFVRQGYIQNLEEDQVTPLLRKGLKWRVVSASNGLENPRVLSNEKVFRVGISCKSTSPDGTVTYKGYGEVIRDIVGNASPQPTAS